MYSIIQKFGSDNLFRFCKQLSSPSQFLRYAPKIKYHKSTDSFTISFVLPVPDSARISRSFSFFDDIPSVFPLYPIFNISYSTLNYARSAPKKYVPIYLKKSFISHISVLKSL